MSNRKGKRYIPHSVRKLKKEKAVKMPKRLNLTDDAALTAYYRETTLLLAQTTAYQLEMLLSTKISVHERMLLQDLKNNIDKITLGVVGQLSEKYQDLQYDRVHFMNEMIKLNTLVPPKYYEKFQQWTVEKLENVNGLNPKK